MSAAENSRAVSYMGHDSQLLFDTIYNNITLGCDGDIRKVLADVCFDEDLKSMPEGIETKVGASGVRLSGGQQARLALARALYNKSRILVLDDPFSAVDVNTEAKIMDNLRKHYSDCIILLISHRTSAFDRTENVLLLDRGKTRFDTHQNLLNTSQTYRNIICGEEGDCHV